MLKRVKKGDLLVFLLIALVGLGSFALNLGLLSEKGIYLEVSQDGEVIALLRMDEDQVFVSPGGGNTLEIRGGKAWMVRATCPDQLCVHSKALDSSSGSIVCLPNRLAMRIVRGREDIDAISQ